MTEIGLEDCILAIATFGRKITLVAIQEATGIHRSILSRFMNKPRSSIKTEHLDKLLEFFYLNLKECFNEIDAEIPNLLKQYESGEYKEESTNSKGYLIFSNGSIFEDIYAEFGLLFPNKHISKELRDRDLCFWVQTRLIQFFPDIEIDNYEGIRKVKIDRTFDVPTLWLNHTKDERTVYNYSMKTAPIEHPINKKLASFMDSKTSK